jgi:hypothetical protein
MKTVFKIPTIKELRGQGWKVRCSHYRFFPNDIGELVLHLDKKLKSGNGSYFLDPSPRGGKVVIELRDPNGNELRGESVCSKVDAYNKKAGRNLALSRALKWEESLNFESKFKKADKAWINFTNKIYQVEVQDVDSIKVFNAQEGEVEVTFYYYVIDEKNVRFYTDIIFSTKEELIEFISKE